MRLHHATAKRAEENGVTMEHADGVWTGTKGTSTQSHEDPKQALNATIFTALIAGDYPALRLDYDIQWNVYHQSSPDNEPIWTSEIAPTREDIADIQAACDELELDIEEGKGKSCNMTGSKK